MNKCSCSASAMETLPECQDLNFVNRLSNLKINSETREVFDELDNLLGIGVVEDSVADVLRQFLIKNKQEKKSYVGGELLRRVIIAWDRLISESKLTPKALQSNSQKLYPTFSIGKTEEG